MALFTDGFGRTIRMLLRLVAVMSLAVFRPASAQSVSDPEPYRNVDDFGVDLATGRFELAMIDMSRPWQSPRSQLSFPRQQSVRGFVKKVNGQCAR